ncbi:MAG: MBL fold metallo-hydrolase [Firmicutes bacterium]|nr:MBL fold metallo-hydrolase [Bacillota bacterium]
MKIGKFNLPLVGLILLSLLLSGCATRNPEQAIGPRINPATITSTGILKVHFIDVGQGDAILVQTPAGQNLLVDAGENDYGDVVVKYLISQGVKDLDIVVGTHTHSDHIGGLDKVIRSFPVQAVYMPKVTQNTQSFQDVLAAVKNRGLKVTTAQAGVMIPLAGLDCRVLAPVAASYEELNDYSAVIRLAYGSQSFLLTGDASSVSEDQLLNSGVNLQSTVLKVGHHGSYSSSGSSFLAAVAPQFAVISLAAGNDYGYPHKVTLDRLAEAGIKIYRTDQNGTIVFSTDGNSMQVSTAR